MTVVARFCRLVWSRLRSVLGDDAYERYLEHYRHRHPNGVPLERAAFYRAQLDRRWSQVNRCC